MGIHPTQSISKGKENQRAPTSVSAGGSGHNGSFRRLIDAPHMMKRDGGRKEVSRERGGGRGGCKSVPGESKEAEGVYLTPQW